MNFTDLDEIIKQIGAKGAQRPSTFIFAGAGCCISDVFSAELKLPTAWQMREELLRAHYGSEDDKENLVRFEADYHIMAPTPDEVWQELIRIPQKLESYTERIFSLFTNSSIILSSGEVVFFRERKCLWFRDNKF
jgi:hypothetical protein